MPGFSFGNQLPFTQPGQPPNPALFQPAPNTDQSHTTAAILSALARSLFDPSGAGTLSGATASGAMPVPTPVAPIAPQGVAPAAPQGGENTNFAWAMPPRPVGPVPPPSPGGGPAPSPNGATPPPSPGGTMPLPPPMLRPGPDGGDQVAGGGDVGSVLQTALTTGQQAQNSPDITQSVIHDLMTMGGDPEQNKWLALAKAGFAMAASQNPHLLGAAGEGALAGLTDYTKSRQELLQNRYTAAQLQQAAQTHAAEIANQQAQRELQQKEFQLHLEAQNATLPAEVRLKNAQAEYFAQHGNYWDARAGMPGGGTGGGRGSANADLMHWNTNVTNLTKQYIASQPVASMNDPTTMERAYQWALGKAGPRPGGSVAQPAVVQPTAAGGGAPAAAAMPTGALQAAAGVPDGTPGGGGKYVARGGYWYPAGQ